MAPTKLTPLYTTAKALHAEFVEPGGWRLAKWYTKLEQELATARERVGLADVSAHGKLMIEGAAALEALKAAFGAGPDDIGGHVAVSAGGLYRLRPDVFYLSTRPGGEAEAHTQLETAITAHNLFVTVTNQTHGLADLRLIGPASRVVLGKLCGLDFSDEAFPNLTIKQTSVAKTKQMVIRRDFDPLLAYTLVGAQSLATYLWEVILEAGQEFGIAPIGVAALRELER